MKKERFYFASANTGLGFVNYLDKINTENGFQYIIKGSSGSGKSSMMKKIAKHFGGLGYQIEYCYCSSDPESLDGVVIVEKNVSIIDGTAPHVVEADFVKSKIIDFGAGLDVSVKNDRAVLQNLFSKKKFHFENFYKYLSVLETLQSVENNNEDIDDKEIVKVVNHIISDLVLFERSEESYSKNVFLEAIASQEVSLEEKNNFHKIIDLNTSQKFGFCVMEKLKNYLNQKNISCVLVRNNINPNLLNGIIINDVLIKNNQKNNKNNKKIINFAKKEINLAKNYHFEIENIYKKYINFDVVNKITNDLIKEIEKIKC